MEKETRNLLLADLSGRVPYGVKASYYGAEEECETWDEIEGITIDGYVDIGQYSLPIEGVKPYLFPLSSMTEEQMDKVEEILMGYDPKIIFDFIADGDIVFKKGDVSIKAFVELMQYFDKEMLDYRGLIKKGLAIDCTDLNIY